MVLEHIWNLLGCLFTLLSFLWFGAADSGIESTDSDDEFQICEICTTEEVAILFKTLEVFWYLGCRNHLLFPAGKEKIATVFLLQ